MLLNIFFSKCKNNTSIKYLNETKWKFQSFVEAVVKFRALIFSKNRLFSKPKLTNLKIIIIFYSK